MELTPNNKNFDKISFGKDVLILSTGQILIILLSVIQSILLPKYLTKTDYGYLQLFFLYGSYAGLLHLGFTDGLLVRWSGKKLTTISNEIKYAFSFLILEQSVIIVLLVLFCYVAIDNKLLKENIYLLFIYMFTTNIFTFFLFLDQAIKRFTHLTTINICKSMISLALIVIIISVGIQNHYSIAASVISSFIIAIFLLLISYYNYFIQPEKISMYSIYGFGIRNIEIGLFILSGNFIFSLSTSIDRLLISKLFPIEQFAMYTFAVTFISVIYIFIGSISQVIFPYICEVDDYVRIDVYRLAKSVLIISWAFVIGFIYLPLTIIIKFYLPEYIESIPLIKIMLCSICFVSLIQILHINYYKLYGKQREFFTLGLAALILLSLLNILIFIAKKETTSIAFASLLGLAIWYIINESNLKDIIRIDTIIVFKDFLVIVIYIAAFWLQFFIPVSPFIQTFFYITLAVCITLIMLKKESKELINKLFLKHNIRYR